MGRPEPDTAASQGVLWATRATSIALEFALPPLLGAYLDRRLGTGSLLILIGAVLGFLAGMAHVLAVARGDAKTVPPRRRGSPPDGGGDA